MLTYYFIYFIPFFLALNYNYNRQPTALAWLSIGFFYSIIIGWRDRVGGDWYNYLRRFEEMQFESFESIITGEDPGYYIINYLTYQLGFEIYTVNFICAIIFMLGLIKLAKREYNPWMVLAVAVPYTILIVAMGYTRQGVALGFVMWALVHLRDNNMIRFFLLVILAATFHKSAVVIIGFGIFAGGGGKFLKFIAVLIIGIGVWSAFLAEHQDRLIANYVDAQMQSQGAFIRTFMNLIPAILFILYRKKWKEYFDDYAFWMIMALTSIFSFLIVGFASTAVDRMALYLLPIQMIVYSRLAILMQDTISPQVVNISILFFYLIVLTVWLQFAVNAFAWIPYNNMILTSIF
jgi:hypothetical protein